MSLRIPVLALGAGLALAAIFAPLPESPAWGPALFRGLLGLHGCGLLAAGYFFADRELKLRGSDGKQSRQALARGEILGLCALALAALALRLYRLDSQLWVDEVFMLLDFGRAPLERIVAMFPSQNQHLLYSLAARVCTMLFGESAWALRLPAAVAGVLTVFPLYLLGRKLWDGRTAFAAAALLTVSYHHVWFSQNARGYSALLLFTVWSTWLWLEAVDRDEPWLWAGYAVTLVLGLGFHLTMIFVIAAHGLVWLGGLVRSRSVPIRGPLWAWLLGATLTLQIYAMALPEFFSTALHETSMDSEWTRPLWVIAESIRNLQVGWSGGSVVAIGGLVLAAGWLELARRRLDAAALFVLPPLMGGAVTLAMGHNLWPRFFFFAMGFALLLALGGAFALPKRLLGEVHGRRVGAVLATLLIVASAATLPRCYALPKQDFEGARNFAQGRSPQVISPGIAGRIYSGYYAPDWTAVETIEELAAAREAHPDAWLVYTLAPEIRAFQPEVWDVLDSDYAVERTFYGTLGQGEIYVCRPTEPAR